MSIATFRGESSITEIADNLFAGLTAHQRKNVESKILKANPQLRDLSKVRKGSILRIPEIPELRAKVTRNLEKPDVQIVKDLSIAVNSFLEHVTDQGEVEEESIKVQREILKNGVFQESISSSEALLSLSGEADKALAARTKLLNEQQKEMKSAIGQGLDDLSKLLK
ncbi:hypothetical protein [Neptunomonas japonica]|uniref:hypothetical protein n=1 Tax=Neptunomonas japonica TaxID=417574 RepID=UPI00041DE693|nr:hypothetical protein [Neptunomonas japonica]